MRYLEKQGDLFAEENTMLAHCISADYALGAGIAVPFDRKYNMKEKLNIVGTHKFPDVIMIDEVFNLVTKDKCYHKPTYQDLQSTLIQMRKMILELGVPNLAIPKIGCGIDGLDWGKVSEMIKETFKNVDISITVCTID